MQDIGFDYKHTRYPLDQDGVLSETLGIPGFLPAPEEEEEYPETTFGVEYLTKGYFEKKPAGLDDYGSLLKSPREVRWLVTAVRKDTAKWEHERSSQVIHRSDGLERFLKKVQSSKGPRSGAMSQKDRNKWKEEWVVAFAKGACLKISAAALETIPYFQLKSLRSFTLCAVLETLSSCECPLVRASWFIKITCLKNQLEELSNLRYNRRSPADTTLSGRSAGGGTGGKSASALGVTSRSTLETKEKIHRLRTEWTLHFLDYWKSKIWDIAEYKVEKKSGYPSQYRPVYANKVKTSKKRPLTPSTKQPSPKPVINEKKLHQFNYACRLARWQFDEGLFNKVKFLDDLLDIMRSMRDHQTQRRKPGLPLSLCCSVVAYILEYVESMSLKHIERLWFICTKQLCQLLWTGSSNEDSLYFDCNFQPLCTLLRLGLHSASRLGQHNVADWEEKIYGVQRKQSDWNPIYRIMKGLSTSSTPNKSYERNSESRTSETRVKPGFFTSFGNTVFLDFSKAQHSSRSKAWQDPWIQIEKVPNTKSLYNMLSQARKLKRVPR